MPDLHPHHDEVARAVRDWFHAPYQDMGYRAERTAWGTCWNTGMVFVSDLAPDNVGSFLDGLRAHYADALESIYVMLDSRDLDARLGPVLVQAGCRDDDVDLFLAHVGSVPDAADVPGLTVEAVDESNLADAARAKLLGFAGSEAEPDTETVATEIARRRRELGGIGRAMLARIHGEPAAFLLWYDDPQDLWLKLVATRVPFRGMGIAGRLLMDCVRSAYARGCRSVVLDVSAANIAALRLYHRLGFRDEVYRRHSYHLTSIPIS